MVNFSTCTALVTPYDENGIDYAVLRSLVELQIKNKIQALLVNGSTGEPLLLSESERNTQAEKVIEYVSGRAVTVVGCGGVSTQETLAKCLNAERMGADYLLVVTPYYNKTSQEGAIKHFYYLADRLTVPLIAYNVPSRTGFNLSAKSVHALSKHPNIVGYKDAGGNILQTIDIFSGIGANFDLFCGDDSLTIPFMSIGAKGVISVLSNAVPRLINQCVFSPTPQLAQTSKRLCDLAFAEANPIPIKYVMYRLGLLKKYYLRLPLLSLSEEQRSIVDGSLPLWEEYL